MLADDDLFAIRKTIRHLGGLAILLAIAGLGGAALAQNAPPPPAPPPLTQPSVPILPGAPQPLVVIPAAQPTPLLTPVPVPTALPTAAPRAFNCSCFTTASGTQWAGSVLASDFTAARQAASAACVAYVTARTPPSAATQVIPTPTIQAAPAVTPAVIGPLEQKLSMPPLATLQAAPTLTGQTLCNLCACN